MNFLLDMKTIFITLVCGHFFSVFLISAYWHHHKHDKTLNIFFSAKCLQAVAWLFLAIRGGIPDIFSISLANSLLFIGLAFETGSVLMLLRTFTKLMKKIIITITALNLIGFHLIIVFNNIEYLRIAYASFGTAAAIIIPAYQLFFNRSSAPLKKVLGFLYFVVIISLVLRGAAAMNDHSMGLFTPSLIQSISFLSLYLTMIIGNIGFILLLKEKTDEELIRLATFDDLTNALNRRSFNLKSKQCLVQYRKIQKPVSLILFDLDHFKQINDNHGHDIGDRVLKDLSNHIHQLADKSALFGRYGGDEFAIFLPDTDNTKSSQFAERILSSIQLNTDEQLPVEYTLSIGVVSVIPQKNTTLESLYLLCDKALYESKRSGRNKVSRGFLELVEDRF
ncbi:diguanylate cyclase domain-containing protein [Metabacillus halosaccharovorans]|uniref:diguanylate cyclase domain-containing protein n=1 Tax=Metabacillus halosaccharovorans TaxID=930124 RepID=UPI00403E3191